MTYSPSIFVLGAGAIGCGVASALYQNGHAPRLVSRWREHVAAINDRGLIVDRPEGSEEIFPFEALTMEDLRRRPDSVELAYLTAKCQGTVPYAEILKTSLKESGCVVSLQNGFNLDILAEHLGARRVVGGAALFGAERTRAGRVRRTGSLADLVIGRLGDADLTTQMVTSIAELTTGGEWHTAVSENIEGVVWSKLISNLMVNPLAVVYGRTVLELMLDETSRRLASHIAAEVSMVAVGAGVALTSLPTMDVSDICRRARQSPRSVDDALIAFGRLFPDTRVSSLQDVEAGRETELRYLFGYASSRAKDIGVDLPITSGCYELALRVEEGHARPGQLAEEASVLLMDHAHDDR